MRDRFELVCTYWDAKIWSQFWVPRSNFDSWLIDWFHTNGPYNYWSTTVSICAQQPLGGLSPWLTVVWESTHCHTDCAPVGLFTPTPRWIFFLSLTWQLHVWTHNQLEWSSLQRLPTCVSGRLHPEVWCLQVPTHPPDSLQNWIGNHLPGGWWQIDFHSWR